MNASRLGLGTAQFGLAYGVSNAGGQVSLGEAERILDLAYEAGIRTLDTAAAYGEAEQVLSRLRAGARFEIISKSPPLREGGAAMALAAVQRSLELLGPKPLDAVLVHHARDLASEEGGRLWDGLLRLRADGRVKRIGFSAYFEDDPAALARAFAPDLVQLPLSVLDQRPLRSGQLTALAEMNVAVHARSVFLQGLLFLDAARMPRAIADVAPGIERARSTFASAGVTPVNAALAFVMSRPEVERVIVGVTSAAELRELVEGATAPAPAVDWSGLALDHPRALTPSLWEAA
ncbi:aldo/keto reductase [Terricaulis sp.]|uniref:aldo/keto reductase n=1 Tax=Terricaulis sp. TaxID=2768686 RepID=UPI00378474D0